MIFQSIAKKLLISRIQKSLVQAVGLDKATKKKLKTLNGHLFLVNCTQPQLKAYLQIEKGSPKVFFAKDEEQLPVPNTILEGSASALFKLIQSETYAAALAQDSISLRGDHQAFEKLFQIFKELDIDFELPLSKIVGDVPAHTIGKTLREANKSRIDTQEKLKARANEYISKESRFSPSKEELETFTEDVQSLKQSTERLSAKIQQLKSQLSANN